MSGGAPKQKLDDSESVAIPALLCPLEPSTFLESLSSRGLRILKEIEVHISASKCHHPPIKDLTLHGSLDGTTPLLLACYFGDLNCVKHVVENWHVDFQAAGVYYHDFRTHSCRIESASPLFVAAFNGHIDTVKYLVGLGADVSSKTSFKAIRHCAGLTPLHGAIHQSRRHPESLEIVRFLLESGADPSAVLFKGSPIWSELSCSADIIIELIQHGLNLDQRNFYGETLLHHWAFHPIVDNSWTYDSVFDNPNLDQRNVFGEPNLHRRVHQALDDPRDTASIKGRLAVVELLVNSGADLMARDKSGFTPLLRAARQRKYAVVDFLATRDCTDRMELIDGMEMAAAVIFWDSSNGWNSEQEKAIEYLRKALDLRQIDPRLHMTPLKLKRGRTIGWTTEAQLDQVIEKRSEYILQSYLIQLRICSSRSWNAVFSLSGFLWDCTSCLKQNRLDDLIDVLWATLEKIQLQLLDSHHEIGLRLQMMADAVVINLIWLFSLLKKDDPFFTAETFKTILKVVIMTEHGRSHSDAPRSDIHMNALLRLITFLASLPDLTLNDTTKIPIGSGEQAGDQELSIKDLLRQLVYQDSPGLYGETLLLHLACHTENLNSATVELLLEANADPNAGDRYGNGSLHILAVQHHGNGEVIETVARLLLKNGAHLDMLNKDRKTAAQIWKEKNELQDLPIWLREPGSVRRLKCLSASCIRSYNIPVTKKNLPEILHLFVKWH